MMNSLLDKVGDWNPQLMRELKGRLKIFYVAIAIIVSLIGQFFLFLYQLQYLPGDKYPLTDKYCNLSQSLSNSLITNYCPTYQINMQMWWRDHFENIFLTLSVVFIFILLLGGTYLLINNLAQEEKRGTLNFIRLSPQSESSILIGKMLGVPILVYTVVLMAIPLHFVAGHFANIATSYILIFYTILIACCIFFYSLALLFGLFSSYLSSFQPWLGAGIMLFFLFITMRLAWEANYYNHAAVWLRLLSPFDMTKYLFKNLFSSYRGQSNLGELAFLYLPVGKTAFGLAAVNLLNYGFWNYWVWQGIKRRFRNPNTTILSKKNSYFFVAGFQIILWGFTMQPHVDKYCDTPYKCQYKYYYNLNTQISNNFPLIILFNVLLLFVLLAIISPHRQAIQDWARYRYERFNSFLKDVIWAEKSPAHIAMLINLLLVTIPMFIWIIIAPALNFNGASNNSWWIENTSRLRAILSLIFLINLMIIYSTIAQRMLMMKSNKRSLWAGSTIGALMLLPPIVLGLLRIYPEKYPTVWLFSTFPWAGLEDLAVVSVFSALIFEFGVLVLLNFNLHKQVKLAGESASKALMSKD
ncbi:MAG: ABC transporter permease [Calothrix sp. MO_167.B12]|nr:ABC transporter permease [Calothrix sp. MO_167.B12]